MYFLQSSMTELSHLGRKSRLEDSEDKFNIHSPSAIILLVLVLRIG
jgi:hypothetical protein